MHARLDDDDDDDVVTIRSVGTKFVTSNWHNLIFIYILRSEYTFWQYDIGVLSIRRNAILARRSVQNHLCTDHFLIEEESLF